MPIGIRALSSPQKCVPARAPAGARACYVCSMRTTVEFDPDTAKAVEDLRAQGKGVSEAVNTLIRAGLVSERSRAPFVQRTRHLGIRIDVSNVADALEVLEGSDAR